MLTLGIETSTPLGSLALVKDSKTLAFRQWQRQKSHSELVTLELELLLQEADLRPASIERIGVSVGPGSFTGLRVGINLARTLAYALELPVAGIDSLRVLAEPLLAAQVPRVLAVAAAFGPWVYASAFEHGNVILAPGAFTAESLLQAIKGEFTIVGDGLTVLKNQHPPGHWSRFCELNNGLQTPSASVVATLAAQAAGGPERKLNWTDLKPLYIRASEAEEKLRQSLV